MKAPIRKLKQVEVARQNVEARLADVQTAVKREVAWLPSGKGWLLPMIGLAFGVRLARRGKPKKPTRVGEPASRVGEPASSDTKPDSRDSE